MNHISIRIKLAAILCYAAASVSSSAQDPNTIVLDEIGVKNLRIETVEVEEEDFDETVFALGRIAEIPERHAVVSSRISGRVVGLDAHEGDTVEAGSIVVSVESRQPGNPPPIIELKAPIGGLVVESHVRLGEPVEPDKELLDVSDLKEVYAIARVPEHYAAKLAPGSKARIVVAALGKQIIEGEMLRFGTSADSESGTIDAVFRVANPELRMRPEMRAEFNIVLASRTGILTVPRSALQGGPSDRHVFVTDFEIPNMFHRSPVRAGQISGDRVEILSGVFPGDQVVTTGSYPLGFSGGGSMTARDALEAAHGHEHNDDGSEPTPAQEAEQRAAKKAAASGHATEPSRNREWFFMATTIVFALLLVVMSIVKRRPETTSNPS